MLGMPNSLYEQHNSFRIYIFDQIKFHKRVCPNVPTLNEDNGQDFMNNYYCVGHTWTECNEEGKFIPTQINQNILRDWYEDDDDENIDEYMI